MTQTGTLAEIVRIVRDIMAERLPPEVAIDSDTQFEEVGVDSFEAIQIIAALQETFKIRIDPGVSEDALTVGELEGIVRRALQQALEEAE